MIALVDVTRVKEMEKVMQLREKMASLGQVAAGIAHEIRNPLSGINIFLEGIALMHATLRKRDIVIESDLSDSLPPLFLDSLLIEQAVMNLINNAADAMKNNAGHKRIKLTTTQIRNNVFLSISDSGTGVPAGLRKKIFDPFLRPKQMAPALD
ncbi:MAG: ATP-binding protein [Pseudomonadota bacterium]